MSPETIRELFLGTIDRTIEEVIKVDQSDDVIVRDEINEYILTESIERNLIRVLDPYRESRNHQSSNIAVWISGFFGAGKSSFAKYLGLALANHPIGDDTASKLLAIRATDKKIEALLGAVNSGIPTDAVIFDVSADRDVQSNEFMSAIMYKKLIQHLGYSSDLRVAELEIELEESDRFNRFLECFSHLYPSQQWDVVKTRRMQAMSIASAVLHELDPTTYPERQSFSSFALKKTLEISPTLLAQRATTLMERKKPGRNLIFVIDEVSRDS